MEEVELIKMAELIAAGLPEVTRSEWIKWTQIVQVYGLEKSINASNRLSEDITLRPAIKRSNQLIAKTMKQYLKNLNKLDVIDQNKVLGYVSKILAANTVRGSLAGS